MKNLVKKVSLVIALVILLTALLTSCGQTTTTTGPTTVTDQMGRTVNLTTNQPQRIISLSPSNTEILYALGLADRIAGVCNYSDFPAEAANKPSVGAYDKPDFEKLVSLNPDLVLGNIEHEHTIMPQLESKGIPVLGINPKSINGVMDSITLIGKVTGKDKEAAAMVKDLQSRIERVTNKTKNLADSQKPRVFYIIWNDPLWTTGANTFHDELIQMAGGVNIAHNLDGYADISLETVVADNPQIIIAGVGMGTGEDVPFDYAKTEPRLKDTEARVNNQVFSVNMDTASRPGPRLVDALEDFLAIIHPELRDQPN
jgi:iron complex transport system substrate-binding protein